MTYNIRYIARITLQAETPLIIGSGKNHTLNDTIVAKDFNMLPYIPASAIAGFLQRKFENKKDKQEIFGGLNENKNFGSRLILSDAYLLSENKTVLQQKVPKSTLSKFLLKYINHLPVRNHVAINDKGSAKDQNLFNSELVFKGSRFKLELEFMANNGDKNWEKFLEIFSHDIYLGSGTTNGSGKLSVIHELSECIKLDLSKSKDIAAYSEIDVDLNKKISCAENFPKQTGSETKNLYEAISLNLKPDNSFFIFGAGHGYSEFDKDTVTNIDEISYKEFVVEWKENGPEISEYYVIPGTSVKGTLAHRVLYLWNKKNNSISAKIDNDDYKKRHNKENNNNNVKEAIMKERYEEAKKKSCDVIENLFGKAKDDSTPGKTGKIIVEDTYLAGEIDKQLFTHNTIDRFTSGTIDSALFNEEVLSTSSAFSIKIFIEKDVNDKDLLLEAVKDIETGIVQLGGKTTKGYGKFKKTKNQ